MAVSLEQKIFRVQQENQSAANRLQGIIRAQTEWEKQSPFNGVQKALGVHPTKTPDYCFIRCHSQRSR